MDQAKNLAMAPAASALYWANLAETLMGYAGAAIKSGFPSVLHALDDGASGRCIFVIVLVPWNLPRLIQQAGRLGYSPAELYVKLQRCLVRHLKYRWHRSRISRIFRERNRMMKPQDANLRQWVKSWTGVSPRQGRNSSVTDTQHKVAASRRLLRSGQRQVRTSVRPLRFPYHATSTHLPLAANRLLCNWAKLIGG